MVLVRRGRWRGKEGGREGGWVEVHVLGLLLLIRFHEICSQHKTSHHFNSVHSKSGWEDTEIATVWVIKKFPFRVYLKLAI